MVMPLERIRLELASTIPRTRRADVAQRQLMEESMRALPVVAIASCLMTSAVAAQEAGPVDRGRNVAMQLCSGCHVVAAGQRRPSTDAAPTFNAIANRPGMNETALQNFLRTPHPIMPMLILSPEEMRDVASFVMSLKGR